MTHKSTKMELELRRKTIMDMTVQGHRKEEIMTHLSISQRTFERDMDEIRQEMIQSLHKKDPAEIFFGLDLRRRGRMLRLWRLTESTETTVKEKISAISSLRDEDSWFISILQTFGLLGKESGFGAVAGPANGKPTESDVYKTVLMIKAARDSLNREEEEKRKELEAQSLTSEQIEYELREWRIKRNEEFNSKNT